MAENFPKLMTDTKPQIQEAQRTPNRIKKKSTHRHIVLKFQKVRQRKKY